MATVYTLLDTRRIKSDNTYPIVFRVVNNRQSTTIHSGYSVKKQDWDEDKLKIKSSCRKIKSAIQANANIKNKEASLNAELSKLEHSGLLNELSTPELRKKLLGTDGKKKKKLNFTQYTKQIIQALRDENRLGTAKAYNDALSFLLNYNDGKDIEFYQLSAEFLTKLEKRYMYKTTNHYNGLAAYLRSIRAVCNKAIIEGYCKPEYYPFRRNVQEKDKYRIKKEKTSKRAVSKEFIQLVENYDKHKDDKMYQNAKNFFLFSFYMRGINMVDMAKLRPGNIVNNHLEYRRSKTGKSYKIYINDKAKAILNYYGLKRKTLDYHFLFPIIKRWKSHELVKKDINNAVSNTNKYLKLIAKDLGFEEKKLTTYVSRHSWATIADKEGIDRRIISQGLGHGDLGTTAIYIDDIVSDDVLTEADKIIIGV